ncbi:unnamed protein product [Dibothriocephalus latus]|uniref:Uncharacterized protein n=1 Tax=Dibothriocephalus latus TaxID=60516 RepID=A0A3P7LF46_DIBLA|nr:unnamed protein product [Dibothriocephalus latus]
MGSGEKDSTSRADVQNNKEEEKNELFGQIQVSPEQVVIKEQECHDGCATPLYGRTVTITLLDYERLQLRLSRSYAMAPQSDDRAELKCESFDFHRECSAHQWHRLNSLFEQLEPELVAMR